MLRYCVCFIALLFSGPATAGLNEGYQAYDNKNYEKAFKEFYPLAKNGDVEAQFVVAMMYDRGKGVEEDPAKTIYWLTKAAEQGHVYGQSLLGAMYYVGRNVKKDNVAALYWFKRSAMGGRPESQYFVGNMYYEGEKGVLFDWVEAYAWLSAAAEQGIEPAKQKKMILEEKLGSGRLAEAKKLAKKYHELYVQPFINRPNKALQPTPKSGAAEHHR